MEPWIFLRTSQYLSKKGQLIAAADRENEKNFYLFQLPIQSHYIG